MALHNQKQLIVVISTIEVEYILVPIIINEFLWLHKLLIKLGYMIKLWSWEDLRCSIRN